MTDTEIITPEMLGEHDLTGRPYLHEQGQYVGRGFVEKLTVKNGRWTLTIRDIDYLKKSDGTWCFDKDSDSYGGEYTQKTFKNTPLGFFTIASYGMEVYIGPHTENPWLEINWPELDGFEGGPMDLSSLTKRDLKKLKQKLRKSSHSALIT